MGLRHHLMSRRRGMRIEAEGAQVRPIDVCKGEGFLPGVAGEGAAAVRDGGDDSPGPPAAGTDIVVESLEITVDQGTDGGIGSGIGNGGEDHHGG